MASVQDLPIGSDERWHYCLLTSLGPVKGGNGMKHGEVVIDFSRRGMVELFRAMPLVPLDAIKAASAKASTSARFRAAKSARASMPFHVSNMRIIETFLRGHQPKPKPMAIPPRISIDTSW